MGAFILTYNPSTARQDAGDAAWLARQAARFARGGRPAASRWSSARKRGYEPGDRVYLLRQGTGPRGIIGSGIVRTGEVYDEQHWKGGPSSAHYIDISWDAFVPENEALPTSDLQLAAPHTHWRPQGSGTAVAPDNESAVETLWQHHLRPLRPPAAGRSASTAEGLIVAIPKSYRDAHAKVRLHQKRFRLLLLEHYPHRCAYCGVDVIQLLEAAHLVPDSRGGAASVENGRLLCANHHRAYDAGLLTWSRGRFVPAATTAVPPLPPTSANDLDGDATTRRRPARPTGTARRTTQ